MFFYTRAFVFCYISKKKKMNKIINNFQDYLVLLIIKFLTWLRKHNIIKKSKNMSTHEEKKAMMKTQVFSFGWTIGIICVATCLLLIVFKYVGTEKELAEKILALFFTFISGIGMGQFISPKH